MIIHPSDNVEVRDNGHKYALRAILNGENVIKYGMPIGHAVTDISAGELVHVHNLKTNLSNRQQYQYQPDFIQFTPHCSRTFLGFERADGQIGIRNDIWIIPTVGCINKLVERLAQISGAIPLTHPYGCSQLGEDHEMTAQLLACLVRNPNAGGVLVIGLGCENNTLNSFKLRLGDVSKLNIRFMAAQDEGDEVETALKLLADLQQNLPQERREFPVSRLVLGLKCGGSDGFSGITANPAVGRCSDWLLHQGGSAILTEVPEMFGAETLLMNRCINREIFQKCVKMIDDFKDYYIRNNQVIYENPSPGNKAGGITTLEEKSLGCVQKGGHAPVVDVLKYGERIQIPGLNLLSGPGNDMVAATVLAAAGAHMLLFTTGRGTPFGSVIPTLKIASNTLLTERKPHWIDFNAGLGSLDELGDKLIETVLKIASGEQLCRNETNKYREIAIFKQGVTL